MKKIIPYLLMAFFISACGDDGGGNCGEKHDGVPVIIDEDEDYDTFYVASIGVYEWNQMTGADIGHTTTAKAYFEDFTNYRVQVADRLFFSEACFIYTSRQVTTGDHVPMGVDQVTIGGLAGGDLVMTPDPDRIPPEILPGRAFESDTVTFNVTSAGGALDFPAFSSELGVPDQVVIKRLGQHKDPDLVNGVSLDITLEREEPLQVVWEAGNGDYFEFKLIPGAGSSTAWQKLRCITYDDGCLEIPAPAINHLALDEATNFQIKVERHNQKMHVIKDGDVTQAIALLDASSWLGGVVGR
ncbi:hypothetical protein ACFL2F_00880 [Myxococcota bacterium]